MEYDGELEPQRAYAVHVDEKWIRVVLERERKIDTESVQHLHKKILLLTYSEADRIPALTAFDRKVATDDADRGASGEGIGA